MALYLVQHGKSLPKDIDPDQSLSDQGIAETKSIAGTAKKYGIHISTIKHSGKTRAEQTAEIFAAAWEPEKHMSAVPGMKPLDDVSAFATDIAVNENVMLIGHLPFMERMASFLITGSIDKPVCKFQNSGIVCLDKDRDTHSWIIIWTLMPTIN